MTEWEETLLHLGCKSAPEGPRLASIVHTELAPPSRAAPQPSLTSHGLLDWLHDAHTYSITSCVLNNTICYEREKKKFFFLPKSPFFKIMWKVLWLTGQNILLLLLKTRRFNVWFKTNNKIYDLIYRRNLIAGRFDATVTNVTNVV